MIYNDKIVILYGNHILLLLKYATETILGLTIDDTRGRIMKKTKTSAIEILKFSASVICQI